MSDHKPCPWCGCRDLDIVLNENDRPICVACDNCGAHGPLMYGDGGGDNEERELFAYAEWDREKP